MHRIRIAILADVHANLPALTAVLADAREHRCERLYHAGDLIGIGPYPAEVVDLARASGMHCVQGNHEAWVTTGLPPDPVPGLLDDDELLHQQWTHSRLNQARRDSTRELPHMISETLQGVRVTVVHCALATDGRSLKDASPRWSDAEILDLFTDTPGDLVCFGHLHERRFNREYCGRHFLNPGAAGYAARLGHCGFRPGVLLVFSYLALLAFSKSHRTPYDRLAGSQVLVKVQPAGNPHHESPAR